MASMNEQSNLKVMTAALLAQLKSNYKSFVYVSGA